MVEFEDSAQKEPPARQVRMPDDTINNKSCPKQNPTFTYMWLMQHHVNHENHTDHTHTDKRYK